MDTLYNGSVGYAKITNIVEMFTHAIISFLLGYFAYYIIRDDWKYKYIDGTVTSSICNTPSSPCIIDISYNIDNTQKKITIQDPNSRQLNSVTKLQYNSSTKSDPIETHEESKLPGILVLSFGSILFFMAAYNSFYLITHSRLNPVLAAQGARGILNRI
jgi:hypothetical protein